MGLGPKAQRSNIKFKKLSHIIVFDIMCTGKFYNTINIISFFVLSNVTELPALEFWKKEESSFPYLAKIA